MKWGSFITDGESKKIKKGNKFHPATETNARYKNIIPNHFLRNFSI